LEGQQLLPPHRLQLHMTWYVVPSLHVAIQVTYALLQVWPSGPSGPPLLPPLPLAVQFKVHVTGPESLAPPSPKGPADASCPSAVCLAARDLPSAPREREREAESRHAPQPHAVQCDRCAPERYGRIAAP
jgi:hypothetical protein